MKEKDLPAGWRLLKLRDAVTKVGSGITPKGGKESYLTEGIPLIRSQNVLDGILNISDVAFISEEQHKQMSGSAVKPADVLLNITGASIGRSCVVPDRIGEANVNQHVCIIRPTSLISPHYLNLVLCSNYGKQLIDSYQAGGGRQGLNFEQIKAFPIPTPPLVQQKQIANSITIWDEAIALQTRQLQQLRRRAGGLRQDLLLEKRRLAGFSKPWQEVKIGSLVKEVKRPVAWDDDEEYALISIRRRSGGAFLRERLFGHQILTKNLRTARAGDFLISKMQVVHGASGLVPAELDGMKVSGSYVALVSRNPATFDINFLDCLSKLSWFYHLCYVCSYGVHIEKMTFDLNDFLDQTIRVPELAEQRAIAEVLNTAEAEIHLTERKLDALRAQKRGLLQQLLTGEILLS